MMNRYEIWLANELQKINNFSYGDIRILDEYPLDISKKILKILIEHACLGQNYGPIELARKRINEINKDWLEENFFEVALSCIDFADEWEYRRLVELVVLDVPELLPTVLDKGRDSANEEVREVVEEYSKN